MMDKEADLFVPRLISNLPLEISKSFKAQDICNTNQKNEKFK